MTLKNSRAPLLCCFQLCAWFHCHMWIQTGVRVRKRLSWVLTSVTLTFDLWPVTFCMDITFDHGNNSWKVLDDTMMGTWWQRCDRQTDGRTDGRTDRRTDRRTDWTSHIAAWSQLKMTKFFRQHIPIHFIERKFLYSANFTSAVSPQFARQTVSHYCSDYGFTLEGDKPFLEQIMNQVLQDIRKDLAPSEATTKLPFCTIEKKTRTSEIGSMVLRRYIIAWLGSHCMENLSCFHFIWS